MNKYLSEIFAEFTYDESITYEELLVYENMLMENLEGIFKDGGAEHLDFTPMGDMLMGQCALEISNLEILRDMAEEIAFILPQSIKGRLLCLQKNLESYDIFWLERGQWRESRHLIPTIGPDDLPLFKIRAVLRENPEKSLTLEDDPLIQEDDPRVEKQNSDGNDV